MFVDENLFSKFEGTFTHPAPPTNIQVLLFSRPIFPTGQHAVENKVPLKPRALDITGEPLFRSVSAISVIVYRADGNATHACLQVLPLSSTAAGKASVPVVACVPI